MGLSLFKAPSSSLISPHPAWQVYIQRYNNTCFDVPSLLGQERERERERERGKKEISGHGEGGQRREMHTWFGG
jgi:hypothetical protein